MGQLLALAARLYTLMVMMGRRCVEPADLALPLCVLMHWTTFVARLLMQPGGKGLMIARLNAYESVLAWRCGLHGLRVLATHRLVIEIIVFVADPIL